MLLIFFIFLSSLNNVSQSAIKPELKIKVDGKAVFNQRVELYNDIKQQAKLGKKIEKSVFEKLDALYGGCIVKLKIKIREFNTSKMNKEHIESFIKFINNQMKITSKSTPSSPRTPTPPRTLLSQGNSPAKAKLQPLKRLRNLSGISTRSPIKLIPALSIAPPSPLSGKTIPTWNEETQEWLDLCMGFGKKDIESFISTAKSREFKVARDYTLLSRAAYCGRSHVVSLILATDDIPARNKSTLLHARTRDGLHAYHLAVFKRQRALESLHSLLNQNDKLALEHDLVHYDKIIKELDPHYSDEDKVMPKFLQQIKF